MFIKALNRAELRGTLVPHLVPRKVIKGQISDNAHPFLGIKNFSSKKSLCKLLIYKDLEEWAQQDLNL
jgi:hypothetical protein